MRRRFSHECLAEVSNTAGSGGAPSDRRFDDHVEALIAGVLGPPLHLITRLVKAATVTAAGCLVGGGWRAQTPPSRGLTGRPLREVIFQILEGSPLSTDTDCTGVRRANVRTNTHIAIRARQMDHFLVAVLASLSGRIVGDGTRKFFEFLAATQA